MFFIVYFFFKKLHIFHSCDRMFTGKITKKYFVCIEWYRLYLLTYFYFNVFFELRYFGETKISA